MDACDESISHSHNTHTHPHTQPEPNNPNRTLCLVRGPELSEASSATSTTTSRGSVGGGWNESTAARQRPGGKAGVGTDIDAVWREYQTVPIVLGTRALRSLYVVLDLERHRVRER